MHYLLLLILFAQTLSADTAHPDVVKIAPDDLVQIIDQLMLEDIAEVDLDPATFDLPEGRSRKLKKDPLDDIEFM
ncbi:MAG: hypothetical protein ACK5MA_04335 [Parachlamydiaceae bacterium]